MQWTWAPDILMCKARIFNICAIRNFRLYFDGLWQSPAKSTGNKCIHLRIHLLHYQDHSSPPLHQWYPRNGLYNQVTLNRNHRSTPLRLHSKKHLFSRRYHEWVVSLISIPFYLFIYLPHLFGVTTFGLRINSLRFSVRTYVFFFYKLPPPPLLFNNRSKWTRAHLAFWHIISQEHTT